MENHIIKNFDELVGGDNYRKIALEIVEAGLFAINTEKIINDSIILNGPARNADSIATAGGEILKIKDKEFNLSEYKRVRLFGFGKASLNAIVAIEKILDTKITDGVVIDINIGDTKRVKSLKGSHPVPSIDNFNATKEIVEMAKDSKVDDLILIVVSGGGSSLLSYPETEYKEGKELYEEFLKSGGTIKELNTIRKHISQVKGGGLAEMFYGATIVGLIFCDVSGERYSEVASGPTYKDETTNEDVKKLMEKYNIKNDLDLIENPKDDKYFGKVTNIGLVSNKVALEAMLKKTEELNLSGEVISWEIFDSVKDTVFEMVNASESSRDVILAGGEPKLEVTGNSGTGGRNLYLTMAAIPILRDNQLLVSIASDGRDNSDVAGAIIDKKIIDEVNNSSIDYNDYMARFDSLNFLKNFNNMIITGPTGSNVSDLIILINKK
ncbi:MAG: DUF4147 domain-containing protein [Candidatus Paceibacterota bacterium]|jgi:glycerate-2-kinase